MVEKTKSSLAVQSTPPDCFTAGYSIFLWGIVDNNQTTTSIIKSPPSPQISPLDPDNLHSGETFTTTFSSDEITLSQKQWRGDAQTVERTTGSLFMFYRYLDTSGPVFCLEPKLPCTVCKQLHQLLWATQADRNKINKASNNKRISLFYTSAGPIYIVLDSTSLNTCVYLYSVYWLYSSLFFIIVTRLTTSLAWNWIHWSQNDTIYFKIWLVIVKAGSLELSYFYFELVGLELQKKYKYECIKLWILNLDFLFIKCNRWKELYNQWYVIIFISFSMIVL